MSADKVGKRQRLAALSYIDDALELLGYAMANADSVYVDAVPCTSAEHLAFTTVRQIDAAISAIKEAVSLLGGEP
jgi:hypothetical protein